MGHIDLILGDLLLGIDEGLANCQWFVFVLTPDLGASLDMKGWADAATNLLINAMCK
jgi:hypothetical protein